MVLPVPLDGRVQRCTALPALTSEQWSHRFRSTAEQVFEIFTAHWFWHQKYSIMQWSSA
jgi:hypothetical protein